MSGVALDNGIETHCIDGVDIRVYSAAKTVADCFKFRNRVGLDVAKDIAAPAKLRRLFNLFDAEPVAGNRMISAGACLSLLWLGA